MFSPTFLFKYAQGKFDKEPEPSEKGSLIINRVIATQFTSFSQFNLVNSLYSALFIDNVSLIYC